MKAFVCAKGFVVAILILCGIANRVNGVSWIGPPDNIAIAHGQTGTITCKASDPPYWSSFSPPGPQGERKGLGNTNNDTLPGYSISEFPCRNYHLHFTGNVSSTPTIISCSESASGIERKVHVIVIKFPVFNKTSTANANIITCYAEFRAEAEWRPYFDYEQTNGSETRVGAADYEGVKTMTATFQIAKDSIKTAEVCSNIRFNNSPEDIGKEENKTATNIPELHFADEVSTKSDEACNCESYKNAVICIVVLLLIPLTISVVTLTFKLIHNRKHKLTEAIITSQETEPRGLQSKIETLERKLVMHDNSKGNVIDLLQARIKYLEQHLYPKETVDYAAKPSLTHTIHLSGNNELKPITGITVLGNELFAVTEGSPEIGVYDSKMFQHKRNMEIRGMTNPFDIASSKEKNCLYVVGQVSDRAESKVMRLDREGKVHNHWQSGGQKGRLSTYYLSVVVCLFDEHLITEYSRKGVKIREVRLSPAAKLSHPWHAVKVSSMHFVVSFGEDKDPFHRVCIVDFKGNIKASTKFDELKIFQKMNVPVCLVEDNERFIVVADRDNNRILLLSPHLEYRENFLKIELQKEDLPVRLCFDETNSKLFVAVNNWSSSKEKKNDHRILIFNANSDSN